VKVLVVYAHPVATSFTASLRDVVVATLTERGHDVDLLDLYAEHFEPCLSAQERAVHRRPVGEKPHLIAHADRLRRARALVLVYPTWWAGQPAMLKGWFDRVWSEGVAYTLPEGANRLRPQLRSLRHIVVVTTHGSSKWVNVTEGEGGKRIVGRSLRLMTGWRARVRWVALYGIDRSTPEQRTAFVGKVERAMRQL
jgi:putative NADPH-quinone reductase